jgi:AraC-like DNA-binding protein
MQSHLDQPDAATFPLIDLGLTPDEPVRGCITSLRRDGKAAGHVHFALQVGVLLEGQMESDWGRGWCRRGVGQAWACGPLEAHRWRVLSEKIVEFRFDFLPSLFSQMPNLKGFDPSAVFRSPSRWGPIGSTRAFRRSLAAMGRELACKYQDPVTPGEAFIDLMRFLDVLGKAVTPAAGPEPPPWSDLASVTRIRAALELIEQSCGRRISATEAARICHMSQSTFERAFRRITGFTYARFALRSRIARAARLLRYSESSIKAIARSLGFTDASHFHHAFVAQYGVSPAQYRSGQVDS